MSRYGKGSQVSDDRPALQTRLERWQRLVADAGLDGWLVADFRWNNPLFGRLLGLGSGILTRRCFLWLPAYGHGAPTVIASRVDGHTVAGLDCAVALYGGFEDMSTLLEHLIGDGARVAMEYVERGALPTVSRVDAGLIELLRGHGAHIASSAPLIAALEVWDERQRRLHERAALAVDAARAHALRRCEEQLRRGERVTEGDLVRLITAYFDERDLASGDGPDVAVNAHSADPHYGSGSGEGSEIERDAVLLIDLWARVRDADDAPYADSTWMAYTGRAAPADVSHAFAVTRDARDAAIAAIAAATRAGEAITGRAVDRAARRTIEAAGLTEQIFHRTGHSLGTDHIHGMGTNLDDIEFPDDRPLLVGSGFTVEPGLYWPGRFGIRLEVSAILLPEGPYLTTESQSMLSLLNTLP